jgi:hypothetical protein
MRHERAARICSNLSCHPPSYRVFRVNHEMIFAIPTYRLRDVGAAIAAYDENFWRNGHTVPLIVFDDSTAANCQKYYPSLEATSTANELLYVGPKEKEQFIAFLCKRRSLKSVISRKTASHSP